MRTPPTARWFLHTATFLLAAGLPAHAGSVSLQWDPSPEADGYKVHIGAAAGAYTEFRDVGPVTEAVVDGLPDCAASFFAASAYNAAGDSEFSNEVSSWPRPTVTAAEPGAGEAGTSLEVVLTGLNFEPGASVSFSNPGIVVQDTRVDGCGSITVTLTLAPDAATGPSDIIVANRSGIEGRGAGLFTVTGDLTPPGIAAVAHAQVDHRSAVITWTTDEPATSQVFFKAQGAGAYDETPADTSLVTSHRVVLEGLEPETTYAYHVGGADAAGNMAVSDPDQELTTLPSPYVVLEFEAESGVLASPLAAAQGPGAFAGAWIETPGGFPNGSPEAPLGSALYGVHVPSDGIWRLWVRMYGPDGASNSFFEAVDNAPAEILSSPVTGEWVWIAGRSYTLTAGLHDIRLLGREAGARADRILLTNDPDLVPSRGPDGDQTPPPPPGNAGASVGDGQATLSWVAPDVLDLARIVIRYRLDGRFPVSPSDGFDGLDRASAPSEAGTWTHTGLANGVTVTYSLFAVDAAGHASEPARVSATPGGLQIPDPPGALRVVRP